MPASDTYATFYNHAVLNVMESRKNSAPIYEDKIYIEIKVKGSNGTSFTRPKEKEDEEKYPASWADFVGREVEPVGTPLRCLPGISVATEKTLNGQGIMNIEDLAELSDAVVIGVQGMQTLRKQAKAYVAAIDSQIMDEVKEEVKRKRRKRNAETGELE